MTTATPQDQLNSYLYVGGTYADGVGVGGGAIMQRLPNGWTKMNWEAHVTGGAGWQVLISRSGRGGRWRPRRM